MITTLKYRLSRKLTSGTAKLRKRNAGVIISTQKISRKLKKGTAGAVGFVVLMLVLLGAAGFAGYYLAPSSAKEAVLITVGIIFVIFVLIGAYFAGDTKKFMKL